MEGVYHVYDEATEKLYLDDGREFPINPREFCSVHDAQRAITLWAKRNQLIGANDSVVQILLSTRE